MTAPANMEAKRLDALRALDILETPPEAHLDCVCLIAARLFDTPVAIVTLIDATTVWFKARHGVEGRSMPRDYIFCNDTIGRETGSALIVKDLEKDARYSRTVLAQGEPKARFYAGVPIALRDGLNIGTLCVVDTIPRPDFGPRQAEELCALARIVEAHLRLHEARLRTQKEEHRYRLLAENSTDVIIRSALDARRRYVSPAAKAVLGYDPEELIGTTPLEGVHPDEIEDFARILDDLAQERIEQVTRCQRYRHREGRWVWIEVSFRITRDAATGAATGLVASLRDVCDRKAIEEVLRISEERLALAIDGASDGLWDWDIATGAVRVSGHWRTLLGYAADELAPHIAAWHTLVHPDDEKAARHRLIDHMKQKTTRYEHEYRVRTKSGRFIWTLARGKIVARDADGLATRMVGTHSDITQRKEAERQIAYMATHDGLTGLPNRIVFRERLDEIILGATRADTMFAVLACDLDHFKSINDTLGHPAGDLLLQEVAERLKTVARAGDTVARLGGDEFAIVLENLRDEQDAADAARRAIEAVEAPIELDGHLTRIGVSIGVAIGHRDGANVDQLFKSADIALYRAKAAGRNTFRFFERGMDVVVAERTKLENDLREAVRLRSFEMHYQPAVSLATGSIQGFEALLRWSDPVRGLISPLEFITVAEETGLIVAIGDWALREACREAASWPDEMRVAVNVSAVQFQRPGLEQSVIMALASSGLAADRLELEITESVLMQDPASAVASLHRLRGMGVRIALDDFGTGYSSLGYLRQFPFNKIKIDRAFIAEIANPDTAAIVSAVIGLAARAGAAVTAEGVETLDQLERVIEIGCSEVQGYWFSGPLSAEDARKKMARVAISNAA